MEPSTRTDPSISNGLVHISTRKASSIPSRSEVRREEIRPLKVPSKPGDVRLGEIRPFSFHGKHYVFVVPVTGIFEISELAAEIIHLFLIGAASDGKAVYTAAAIESRSLVVQEVVNALRARYSIHSIVQGLSQLQTLGVLL